MAISRAQKEQNVEELRAELAGIQHAILVDFKGLDVAGASDLRRKLRAEEAQFKVVKNSIVERAIGDLPLAELKHLLVGQTAIAYTEGDVVGLAKTLSEFAKEFETPKFKGGIVDGVPISAEEFEQLAKLPPREELIGKALYLMNYPITGFVTALSGILRSVVTVLDQIREKKDEAGEAETVNAAAVPTDAREATDEAPAEDVAEVQETTEEAPAEDAAEVQETTEEVSSEAQDATQVEEAAAAEEIQEVAEESAGTEEGAPADDPVSDEAAAQEEE